MLQALACCFKHLISSAVSAYGLSRQVTCFGNRLRQCHVTDKRTPQLHNCEQLKTVWVYFKKSPSLYIFVH
jgi:hypothetical protein